MQPRRCCSWLRRGTSKGSERPPARPTVADVRNPPPPAPTGLYSAQEALRDVLSGELEYVGTGQSAGIERSRACAFHNRRVVIVNAYCTLNEVNAFRLDVYSPKRGNVRIYAETRGALSARQRRDYFTFTVESSPPPSSAARLPPLTLAMPYEELRRYEQQRYDAFLPGCFGGEKYQQPVGACLGESRSAPRRMGCPEPSVSRPRERRLVSRDSPDARARRALRRASRALTSHRSNNHSRLARRRELAGVRRPKCEKSRNWGTMLSAQHPFMRAAASGTWAEQESGNLARQWQRSRPGEIAFMSLMRPGRRTRPARCYDTLPLNCVQSLPKMEK